MAKIAFIGTEHMGKSLPICFKRMGNEIVDLKDCDVCWVAIDTPVDKEGRGIIKPIFKAIKDAKPKLKEGVLVVVSSQIPVGTSKKIVKLLGNKFNYAYMPEHMRIGKGVSDFGNLKEVVIGIDDRVWMDELSDMFRGKKVVFTSVATAEMIKHALNAFLATSLSFIYDIADMCEAVGADVTDVARALKADPRIGERAYLDASAGFSGGHLERDLEYLQRVAKSKKVQIPVINAVAKKNIERMEMVLDKLGNVKRKKIAFWGITYKPGAPPSEDSLPAKLMRQLAKLGARCDFCDLFFGEVNPYDTAGGCMAVICITPWPELKKLDFKKVAGLMDKPRILFDARNYFAELEDEIKNSGIRYIGVGR